MRRERQQLLRICRTLYDRFYLVATDGNVSMRIGPDRVLTTPTGANKGFLEPEDLVVTDLEGTPRGPGRPSSELAMHLLVYRLRPEVGAVVHAHPRAATAFAAAGRPLETCLLTESVCGIGQVPLAELALPSTPEVVDSIRELVPRTSTILLRSHGVLCYGADLMAAYNLMESVEQFAQVQLRVEALGGGSIPAGRAQELLGLRPGYGMTAPVIPCDPEAGVEGPVARTLRRLRGEDQ
jgi:L-fuculose-phosphate aldolase